MSKLPSTVVPPLRVHKATGKPYVVLDGRRIYLGPRDAPDALERYNRVVAEWLSNGRRLNPAPEQLTVTELIAAYWGHCKTYYVKPDGSPTGELSPTRMALKPIKELYGTSLASDFGPMALKAVRQQMIELGWARTLINQQIGRIKRMFKWGVENETVPPDIYHGLSCVSGLKAGRCAAKESKPVRPVPVDDVEAILPFVSRQVRAIIGLQSLTAARPSELLKLRAIDFDTSGDVWTVTLREHKTNHRGLDRIIPFGHRAQEIVKEFMANRPLDAFLFSPREARAERAAEAETHRRENQKPNPRKSERIIGEHYDTATYRHAIHRACDLAGVPRWSPNRLRHTRATEVRQRYGLEAAQVFLGHSRADVTQVYAEVNHERAIDIAREIG